MSSLVATLACALLSACGGGANTPVESGGGVASALALPNNVVLDSTSKPQTPEANAAADPLIIRAHGSLAANVGPTMVVRVNGTVIGSVEVKATVPTDYFFPTSSLAGGAKVDVAFTNDESVGGQDRNLFVTYIGSGAVFIPPSQSDVVLDAGAGPNAFDGLNVSPGQSALWGNAALRFNWPTTAQAKSEVRDIASSRFLQQASFGPTQSEVEKLRKITASAWLDEQIAMPYRPDYVTYVQGKYDRGADFLPPNGKNYTPDWIGQQFWVGAATGADQLRKRVSFALHSIFVVSQVDSNLFHQNRAFAGYLDTLNRLAFANYRTLLEEVALSPAMGIYLSHMRNQKEDPQSNRLPDENFARELMQLFTIGLHELNNDGTEKLDGRGKPIETYTNADVMAMAKVFTGWSWGYDDAQLTENNFRWGTPEPRLTGASRVDIRRMKPYPGMSSTAEKRLFQGKSNALTIAANTSAENSVRLALDTLFNHPNVGPFLGRQIIQRLVTSNPSPAYVDRVAQAFNNNGRGVRGDMAAVVRAVLLDVEARAVPSAQFGKVREPVLRLAHMMRSLQAVSASGEYLLGQEPQGIGQRPGFMPSVFGYFRPGYTPPNTQLSTAGMVAPEMQIVDESTVASWFNGVELALREGMGWHGTQRDVTLPLSAQAQLLAASPNALLNNLDLMLFAGKMTPALRKSIVDAMLGIDESASNRDVMRARVAVYIALTSPQYIVQH